MRRILVVDSLCTPQLAFDSIPNLYRRSDIPIREIAELLDARVASHYSVSQREARHAWGDLRLTAPEHQHGIA